MKRLFKNATIIDGSGAPAFQGYVITEKDKIEAVSCGKAPEGFDGEAYDCMGLTVAPGSIYTKVILFHTEHWLCQNQTKSSPCERIDE